MVLQAAPLRADEQVAVPASAAEQATDLGLSIGLRVESGNHRSFRHVEPTTGEQRTYDARGYGGIGVSLEYEQAFAENRFSWSVSGDYWHSLLFTSGARRLGRIVETSAHRMCALAGLSVHPLARPDSLSIGLLAGIGDMGFDFSMPEPQSDDDEAMQLATGNYTYASAGLAARIPLAALAFSMRGSYLRGLHTGAFGGRKAQDQPHGCEVLAIVDYRLLPWLDISLRGGVTLFWLHLAPMLERPMDAPAEVRDLYLALGLGATVRL